MDDVETVKLYKLKKYSILSYKTRRAKELVKTEKFDKMDNRVSTDMLRSGAAIIRKLKHPQMDFEMEEMGYFFETSFIRKPVYYMYVPQQFSGSKFCKKFHQFKEKMFYYSLEMEWNDMGDDISNDYDCLYVRRTKKVVFRAKTFRNKHVDRYKMLALEKVRSKGKVINFDDPTQRDPYYSRLFKLVNPILKKNVTKKYINIEKNVIPKAEPKNYYCCLIDFSAREARIVKMQIIPKDVCLLDLESVCVNEDGETIISYEMGYHARRVMRRGEKTTFEPTDSYTLFKESTQFDVYRNDIILYHQIQSHSHILGKTYDPQSKILFLVEYGKDIAPDSSSGFKPYRNKLRFQPVKKDEESELYFFKVIKDGLKKIFIFEVEEGTLMAVSEVFRKLYLLNRLHGKIDLRVLTFDAIASEVDHKIRMERLDED